MIIYCKCDSLMFENIIYPFPICSKFLLLGKYDIINTVYNNVKLCKFYDNCVEIRWLISSEKCHNLSDVPLVIDIKSFLDSNQCVLLRNVISFNITIIELEVYLNWCPLMTWFVHIQGIISSFNFISKFNNVDGFQ